MFSRPALAGIVALVVVFAGCIGGVASSPQPSETAAESTATETASGSDTGENATGNGTLEVHVIDVGQATSVLVVGPGGETMLVDTGDWQDDGEQVLSYLEREGIDRIDHLVTSHADADHIGGHAAVISRYETEKDGVGAVYDPGIAASSSTYDAYLDAVEEHGVPLYETRENDTIPFAGADVAVLGPPDPYLADGARNENSVVLRISYGNTSFLLPGDAESAQERYLVENYGDDLDATVLKAGHHGSRTSSSEAFLDAVDPESVAISSAYDSQFGHPHNETLRRLGERTLPTYWTGVHGDVVYESDGETVTIATQRAATTNPLLLRSEPGIAPNASGPVEPRERICDAPPVATDGGNATGGDNTTDGGTATDDSTPTATEAPSTPTQTETPTQTPTEGGANVSTALTVAEVHADASGNDNENLNDEYVVFENTGDESLDLSGWTVSDEADHTYAFPDGFTLGPGETVTLRTGSGEDGGGDLYWGADRAVWNNGGDTVIVANANGEPVLREAY